MHSTVDTVDLEDHYNDAAYIFAESIAIVCIVAVVTMLRQKR